MCKTPHQISNEYNFSTKDKWVLWGSDTVAVLTSFEYSKDNGKFVKEKSFRMTNNETSVDIKELLKYLSRNNKSWENELNFEIE
jgi:hypothetical protein